MPIYQYVCSKCNENFELKQSFNDDGVASCPKCKSRARRLFLPVPIIFKGSGFYVTDSKKPSGEQSVSKVSEVTKELSVPKEPESKPQESKPQESKPQATV